MTKVSQRGKVREVHISALLKFSESSVSVLLSFLKFKTVLRIIEYKMCFYVILNTEYRQEIFFSIQDGFQPNFLLMDLKNMRLRTLPVRKVIAQHGQNKQISRKARK